MKYQIVLFFCTPLIVAKRRGADVKSSPVYFQSHTYGDVQMRLKEKNTINWQTVFTFSHICTDARFTVWNTCSVMHAVTHPVTSTHCNLHSFDCLTYFLPTVICCCNCLYYVYLGNCGALSALFWIQNKDSLLIGPPTALIFIITHSRVVFSGTNTGSTELKGNRAGREYICPSGSSCSLGVKMKNCK